MIGYPPTLLATQQLAEKIHEDRARAKEQNVDPDAVALTRTLLETGQLSKMHTMLMEQIKGTDVDSPSMKEHLKNLKIGQQLVLDGLSGKDIPATKSVNIMQELNLTNLQIEVEKVKGLTLLPLIDEIRPVYQGEHALPKHMLLKLQQCWDKEDKTVIIHKYVSGSKRKWLDTALLAVHKNVHEIQDMKNTLWAEIEQNPEIENQLPECRRYVHNMDYSYIRLAYELRRRLSHDSDKLVLYESYRKLAQRTGERATEFISRATALREQAYCNTMDDDSENVYLNPWDQHYEIVLRGFTNKQLMGEISRINPKNMIELRMAVEQTEAMLSRNIRLGLVQGQEDPRALVGLPLPSEEVIQQIQAMSGSCYNCGDKRHFKDQCTYPGNVCYRCKKPGHIKIDCNVKLVPFNQNQRGGKPTQGYNRKQQDKKDSDKIQQLGNPDSAEAVWTPFSHLAGFHSGSQ